MTGRKKTPKRTYNRYDDEFRASAVIMLQVEGYPNRKGALQRVATQTGVSHTVLRDWFHRNHNPPPSEVLQQRKKELNEMLKDLAYRLIDAIPGKLKDASAATVATTLGIVVDKMLLLEKQPTERIQHDITITDEERANRLASIFDSARARRDRQSAHLDD